MMALLAMLALAFSGCSDDDDDNGNNVTVTVENLKGYYVNTSTVKERIYIYRAGEYGYRIMEYNDETLGTYNIWATYCKDSDGNFQLSKKYFFKVQDGKILLSSDIFFSSTSTCTISLYSDGMTFNDPIFGTINMKRVSSF